VPERPGDMDERDVDARFASIVARWDEPVPQAEDASQSEDASKGTATDAGAAPAAPAPPGAPAPVAETGGAPAEEPGTTVDETDAGQAAPPASPRSPWVNPSPLDLVVPASAWRAAQPPDDTTVVPAPAAEAEAAAEAAAGIEDGHYDPPEVVLPPQEDLGFWGAVIGLVAGPLMLLYVVFARPFHSTRWFVAAVVVSLVGFALLILRQPKHRDPTSGDDGARV
jgi:hypothetical protein